MTTSWDDIKNKIYELKNLTAIGFANILTVAISALFWLYMAQLLQVETFGEISYIISIATLAGAVSTLGAGNTLIVYRAKQVKLQVIRTD